MSYVYLYFGAGTLWTWWLEYYTTKHLPGDLGEDWYWKERFLHIFLWPATLSVFLYNVFKRNN
jgi:hypothetical protein